MIVEYIDSMGDDLRAVNCARVSFNKWKEEFDEKDAKLIDYLAKHNHWAPFAHCMATVRVSVPMFVARQLDKHQVGFVKSEVSRRYVDEEPEFYLTDKFGAKAENKKQGSSGYVESITMHDRIIGDTWNLEVEELLCNLADESLHLYNAMLRNGVAPEDARMVLPMSTYTSWIWTGSLVGFARVYNLRITPDAQRQTREVADMIGKIMEPLFPLSWKALTYDAWNQFVNTGVS